MIREHELQQVRVLSGLLVAGLWDDITADLPLEVSTAITQAKWQMSNLPEVIKDLTESIRSFNNLGAAISHMKEVAEEASRVDDEEQRELLSDQFAALSKIVASEAGRTGYQGPKLSLENQAHAKASFTIISYLDPFMSQIAAKLNDQKDLILEAFTETVKFLEIVVNCYPETAQAKKLPELIERIKADGPIDHTRSAFSNSQMVH